MSLPTKNDHHLIVGMNGSGKTVAAIFTFACRLQRGDRWILVDTKGDEHLREIEKMRGVETIGIRDEIPKYAGVYVVHPEPEDPDIEDFLRRIWKRRKTGVLIDEGYMIPERSKAMSAIYTQGRSMEIPVITLCQRPVGINRFAVSESRFRQVFELADDRDLKTIEGYIPNINSAYKNLPQYHSLYYSQKDKTLEKWKPVPHIEISYDMIDAKTGTVRNFL